MPAPAIGVPDGVPLIGSVPETATGVALRQPLAASSVRIGVQHVRRHVAIVNVAVAGRNRHQLTEALDRLFPTGIPVAQRGEILLGVLGLRRSLLVERAQRGGLFEIIHAFFQPARFEQLQAERVRRCEQHVIHFLWRQVGRQPAHLDQPRDGNFPILGLVSLTRVSEHILQGLFERSRRRGNDASLLNDEIARLLELLSRLGVAWIELKHVGEIGLGQRQFSGGQIVETLPVELIGLLSL
jgi:hypothetical protein